MRKLSGKEKLEIKAEVDKWWEGSKREITAVTQPSSRAYLTAHSKMAVCEYIANQRGKTYVGRNSEEEETP